MYMAERWSDETIRLLQSDALSMPAGECFGAVMLADAVANRFEGLTHLWCLTDSVATRSAVTSGSSGTPQLNFLVICGCARGGRQFGSFQCMWRVSVM